jgi:ABC-type glycerol-3-phosphate transport system substrate-binding protein
VPDLAVFVPNRVVKAGHILFLDAYMERDGIARSDYCNLFQTNNIMDDKVFSLPIDTNVWAMMYNKDLFAAAGLPELTADDIVTYDDWLTYARAINKPADNLEERVWGSMFFWPQWNSMGCGTPNYILGPDGRTCTGNGDSGEWLHWWQLMKSAYDEDLTTETAGAMLAEVEEDMFLQGKVGMTYAALGDAIYAKQNGINAGLTAQPVLVEGWDGGVGGWNTNYSILAASQHQEQAWEFLKWLSLESPKVIPIGTDALTSEGEGGLPGLPCYLPLLKEPKIVQMIADEPLVADGVKLMARVKDMPFTPDAWTSLDPYYEGWRRITEDGEDIAIAIGDATAECQEVTDQLWKDWDALGQ